MLLLLTLAACKHDNGLAKRTDVVGANDWPKAVVTPPTLTFGEMSYLETKQLTFTITNEGTDNSALTVDDIVMTAGDDIGYVMQPPAISSSSSAKAPKSSSPSPRSVLATCQARSS
ncbi:MAG: hypothetical protein UY72_C0035G0014 [Candidatus Uhrbacteria bacterium GW2011_GWD2_52_7]|uniref:Uncharacterized protein n=1 Tax=Candidatus Uhrbacteria bacterium GW2011_GWD2_52_7 TaxID=1618989 RepID=A0A0G2ABF0_9BACT|nr:MAG: hypothetical protein UY72_C0035G0014 [Candidatus Uhrbacteria bacterium GW2011_GWD2_52_7]